MSSPSPEVVALLLCALTALTGCEGVTSSSQAAQVRFIEVSADAPPLDLYQNSSAVLFGVGFGTASSYMPVAPGSYTYSVNATGMHQQLASVAATFAAGAQYTVMVVNPTSSLELTLLKDQSAPTPAGQVALRFVHQASRAGAVDLYLVPPGGTLTGTPALATNIPFGSSPTYLRAPRGTYSLLAAPAGVPLTSSVIPLYTGTQSEYTPGSAHTIVLYDQPSVDTPGIQVLTANDIEPAS